MYIVPKKANDMMNVGMLECFTVRELVILLLCASEDFNKEEQHNYFAV